MKKGMFFALLITVLSFTNVSAQGFERSKTNPSFTAMTQNYSSEDISGKIISQLYCPPGTILLGHEISPGKGISLALILIQNPSELQLRRDKPNFIPTTAGYICISYKSGIWGLSFFGRSTHGIMTTTSGAELFTVESKN